MICNVRGDRAYGGAAGRRRRWSGVTGLGPSVGEDPASLRHELPVVVVRTKRQLEDAEGVVVPDLAVRLDRSERVVTVAAHSDDELTDTVLRVGVAGGVHPSEALVNMVVTAENQLDSVVVCRLPELLHREVGTVNAPGAEARLVPHRDRAVALIRGEVVLEPLLLERRVAAGSNAVVAGVVEDDNVPGSEVVAVVALGWISRPGAKGRE